MKRTLLSLALLLGLCAPTLAQVNTVPQVGVISAVQKLRTYSAASVGLVPAASATDIFCINASSTANVSVKQIILSGTAGTAITTPVLFYRRATLDTGGTAATGLALPVGAANISTDSAATVVLTAYTANPTVTDASPALLLAPAVSFSVTTGTNGASIFAAGSQIDLFAKAWDLAKGTTQQLCLNLNAVTITSGVLAISIEWVEN